MKPPINQQETAFPFTAMTPMEMRALNEKIAQAPVFDPETEDTISNPLGVFLTGARDSLTGAAAMRIGQLSDKILNPDASDPLNLTKFKREIDPTVDPPSWMGENNPDTIAEYLDMVPEEELPWILSASTWNEFLNRVTYVKMAEDPVQAEAAKRRPVAYGFGVGTGKTVDIAALVAAGIAAEPLVLSGLPIGNMASQTLARSAGINGTQKMAHAASEAVAAVSRLNMTGRFMGYAMAETAIYHGIREGFDPAYDPEVGEIIQDLVIAGSVGGILGGAVLGRRIVQDYVEEAALALRRSRTLNLPDGTTIKYTPGYAFKSNAEADQMLFAQGTGDIAFEANRIGREIWDDWEKSPVVVDTNIPQAFTPGAPTPTRVRFTTSRGSTYEVMEDGTTIRNKAPRPEHPGEAGLQPRSQATYFVTQDAANSQLSILQATTYQGNLRIKMGLEVSEDGTELLVKELNGATPGRIRGRAKFSKDPQPGLMPIETWDNGAVHFGNEIVDVSTTPGRAMRTVAGGSNRSIVKTAAFELSLAGVKLNPTVFTKLVMALLRTEKTGFRAGAFNKKFWEEVAAEFPGINLRPANERAFVGQSDITVRELVQRDQMVDDIWDFFKSRRHVGQTDNSLIFQGLQAIKDRGGRVNRQTVDEVVDELRAVSQNPPRVRDAKGRSRIDVKARRAAVVQIINKRASSDAQISISPSVLGNLNRKWAARLPDRYGRHGGKVGTDPEFKDIPRIGRWSADRIPGWNRIGNRSAFLHESENGALRLAASMAKEARRSFDTAQPQTYFEAGVMLLHQFLQTTHNVYRNGFVRFALGQGQENVTRKITLMDAIKTGFKSRKMRGEFHKRVAAQMESGAMDDGIEAVNYAAREYQKLMQAVYNVAEAAGLKGFQRSAVANYFPWLWRFDKIRRLAGTEAGRKDLQALIKKSLGTKRAVVIDGVQYVFTEDIDEAATVLTSRLVDIAMNRENGPMLAQDQALFDALLELDGPLKAQQGSRTPFGRSRVILDRSVSITATEDHLGNGTGLLSLADLRNDDLPFVMRKYLTSVIGAVTEKRFLDGYTEQLRARGFYGPSAVDPKTGKKVPLPLQIENVEQLKKAINKLGIPMTKAESEALDTLMGALRFEPVYAQTGFLDKATAVATQFLYLTTGGQFGFAAGSEISRLVGGLGLKTVFKQVPLLREMIQNYRNLDEGAQNFSGALDQLFAPSMGRVMRVFKDELSTETANAGRANRVMDSLANWYSDVTGLAPITSLTQQLAAATTLQHLFDVSVAAARRLDDATVRALGLEPDEYDQIIKFIGQNAEIKDTWLGPRVIGLKNVDAVEMDKVKAFVQRLIDSRIQSVPTRGDFHDKVFSWWSRMLLQFRTFNLKGIDNFLIQNAGRTARGGGIQVAKEMLATGVLAGMIAYARNYANWQSYKRSGDRKRAEEAEKLLTMTGILRGALMGPSEFFLLTTTGDALWTQFVDPDPLFSPYRYSGMRFYDFPAMAAGRRALSLTRDLWGATGARAAGLPAERSITQGTVHRGRLLLPANNYPGFQQLLNFGEQAIMEEYNLQKSQPRDRD